MTNPAGAVMRTTSTSAAVVFAPLVVARKARLVNVVRLVPDSKPMERGPDLAAVGVGAKYAPSTASRIVNSLLRTISPDAKAGVTSTVIASKANSTMFMPDLQGVGAQQYRVIINSLTSDRPPAASRT